MVQSLLQRYPLISARRPVPRCAGGGFLPETWLFTTTEKWFHLFCYVMTNITFVCFHLCKDLDMRRTWHCQIWAINVLEFTIWCTLSGKKLANNNDLSLNVAIQFGILIQGKALWWRCCLHKALMGCKVVAARDLIRGGGGSSRWESPHRRGPLWGSCWAQLS